MRVAGNVHQDPYRPLLHNSRKSFTFNGIKPSETFSLELVPRRPYTSVSRIVLFTTALWFLLGGVGKRSRRGFGTLRLQKATEDFPFTPEVYQNAAKFQMALDQVITKAQT